MTDPGLPAERTSVARPLVLGLLGLCALAAVLMFALRTGQPDTPSTAAAGPAAPPSPALPAAPPVAPPAFDIVRINPQGDAVVAGHAEPGADVTILDAGKDIGHATADNSGNWVMVPTAPLAPGARALTLSEKLADGTSVAGIGSVLMVVPEPAAPAAAPPMAVLDQPGAAPRVLQAPPGGQNAKLGLAAVDYDDHGDIRFAGNAPPGTSVRVYIDNHAAGDAAADSQGRWTLSPSAVIAPGRHRLRLDQLNQRGQVVSRIEVPFEREQLTMAQLGDNRVVVQPGESLWRLARRSYGAGVRYTVIYQANESQIRDPGKIYPGQALTVPPDSAKSR
jgi:hypothetical protein